jgi:hypothetical protein
MAVAAVSSVDLPAPAEAHPGNDGCPDDPPWDRPDGLLISPQGTTDRYLIEDCGKRFFATAEDLQSHHFDSSSIFVSPQETASIATGAMIRAREGTLYRKIGDSGVWIIDVVESNSPAYYKRYISGARWTEHFVSCGYVDGMIMNLPAAVVDTYTEGWPVDSLRPDGQLVHSGGTQYLVEAGKKRPFPTQSALESYNFPFPACSGNLPIQTGATMKARERAERPTPQSLLSASLTFT